MPKGMSRASMLLLAAAVLPSCGNGGTSTTIVQTGLAGAQLSSLTLSSGALSPSFSPGTTFYLVGRV
jgi:hypothetical protein